MAGDFVTRQGNGQLFKNDRKEKPTHPDYRGKINVEGKEYELSAWVKQGGAGKWLSLQVQEPRQRYPRDPGEDL